MNYHTLLASHKRKKLKFTALTAIILISFGLPNSFGQEEQSITLTTNKGSYLPGDIVQLTGMVKEQPSPLVALQVKDSDGNLILIRTVEADQNGNFAVQFKIPPTATSGQFSIMASARINGFVVTETKVFSATVPEFGQIAGGIFGSCLIIMLVTISLSGKLKSMIRQDF